MNKILTTTSLEVLTYDEIIEVSGGAVSTLLLEPDQYLDTYYKIPKIPPVPTTSNQQPLHTSILGG